MTTIEDRPVYTLSSRPAVLDNYEDAMAAARELKPKLHARVTQAEQLRRLPSENVKDILESGLYGLMTPRRFGGSELGPEAMIDVTIELGSACPSTGWVHMLWTAHMWMLAQFPLESQEELWSNPNSLASSVVNTVGDVVPVDGGYRWTGRGFFSSGVDHCNWLTAAVPVKRPGNEDGPAEMRWLLIPREDFEIVDDWFTVGLKGTGSKTIVLEDVFVPEYRTIQGRDVESGRAPGQQFNTNPMYCAISWANFTAAMAAPALGVARGFLSAFQERLRSKSSSIDDGLTINMARFAQASAMVDSVHAMTLQNATNYARVPAREVNQAVRARCRRDQAFTAQTARNAVNFLYEEGGGGSLFESSELQRYWRDVNAAAAHRGLTADWIYAGWAKTLLDVKADPGFLF